MISEAFSRLHAYFATRTQIDESPVDSRFQTVLFERGFILEKEVPLRYVTRGDSTLSHRSDLLLSVFNKKMRFTPVLNVEIKFRSCVSDAFKARAYDQIHLRQTYPHLLGLLIFVKPRKGGLSFEQAKLISYPFDLFFTTRENDLSKGETWEPLLKVFEERMKGRRC